MVKISRDAKQAFWGVVEECLWAFNGFDRARAENVMATYREAVEKDGDEIIYHDDPFAVACDLADASLDVRTYWTAYTEIRERHYHPHGQLVAV